jgi:1-deoxyxylulose-5-phosphate synthase
VTTSTSRGSTETAQRDEGNTEEAESHVRLAADAGITFFDTADMYSDGVSEEVTGAALPAVFGRRDAYLATKVFMPTGPGLRIGSMCAWQFSKAQRTAALHGWTEFVSMQSDYNLLYREEEREMVPLCLDSGIGTIAWSPWHVGASLGRRTRRG